MIAKQFEITDLDGMELDGEFNEVKSKGQFLKLLRSCDDESAIVTFVECGKVIAISGIKHLYGDVGEVFNIRTPHLKARHVKYMKKHLHEVAVLFDRVQAVSLPRWDRWHKAMGFEKEATLRKFMDGKNYSLWVIINGYRNTDIS